MDAILERCCGLDLHKKIVVACLVVTGEGGRPQKEIRTFDTMTDDLLRLADWLASNAVTHVAMESTGVYWKPVYNLLEGNVELLLVNAQHIKAVPGRKTDVRDCEWIADLLRHGLLRASFVPDRPQRELRELTRYRTALIQERTAEVNRLQKTLEGANIKLASVASDIMGISARQMLDGLIQGTTDSTALAHLARGRMKARIPQLGRALTGRFADHQRFLLARQLAHIDFLDESIEQVSAEVRRRLSPSEAAIMRLDTIPGVNRRTAENLIAELGTDMSRFPSAQHLASWAGMCPGQNSSAGKQRSGKTRKGSPWLRSILVDAAKAAGRTRQTYLGAQYHRLLVRRGKNKAAVAVGHTILVIVYSVLKEHTAYQDLGHLYFDQRDRDHLQRRLVARLETMGYRVTLEAPQPAA